MTVNEQNELLIAATADPAYFCHYFCIIDNVQDDGGQSDDGLGVMPFRLWPFQFEMMERLKSDRLTITLKARQLGISWCCCAFALWHMMFDNNRFVLILSRGKPEANEMVRRISVMYHRLPDWFKEMCPSLDKDNTAELGFSNKSRCVAMAATPDAGSGYTASFVIMDEFAKMQYADSIYTAVKPTIDGGGKLAIVSTARGIGNKFHALWKKSKAGQNNFVPIFFPWHARPGRDQQWYLDKIAEATDLKEVQQEYPGSPEEAFIASGNTRFDFSWIAKQRAWVLNEVGTPIRPVFDTRRSTSGVPFELMDVPRLRIYKMPEPGRKYIVTCDPSQGTETGNPGPAMVFDAETWEEVAMMHARLEPTVTGQKLAILGRFYNHAWINVARNNHGHTVIAQLVGDESYRYMVWGPDKQVGWPENVKWKPRMIDALAEALKDSLIVVNSVEALHECAMYRTMDNGKTGAPEGETDDLVTCLALFCAQITRPSPDNRSYAPEPFQRGHDVPAGRLWVQEASAVGDNISVAPVLPNGWSIIPG